MFGLEIKKSAQKYLSKIPIQYRDRIFLGLGAICMGKTENLHIIKLQ